MDQQLRIVIAEDHQTVREGIKMLVNAQPDMIVIGEANDGDAIIKLVRDLEPDLVLMDISMPVMNGLKATKKLRSISADVRILMLTRHSDDGYLRQLIQAGANGYVLKQSAPSELINAIRAVGAGQSFLDPAITQKVMGGFAPSIAPLRGGGKTDLSLREEEVLRFIAFGFSNKEIAARVGLSVKTIEAHKANAMPQARRHKPHRHRQIRDTSKLAARRLTFTALRTFPYVAPNFLIFRRLSLTHTVVGVRKSSPLSGSKKDLISLISCGVGFELLN